MLWIWESTEAPYLFNSAFSMIYVGITYKGAGKAEVNH